MNFEQAMSFINSFSRTGQKVTDLSRIKGLLDKIGNPQDSLRFVHIAGTNGKGSVLEYCSSILINAGYKTGQFTSPFMECYCDRIRINGVNIPEERLAQICTSFARYVNGPFSQFEISLGAALLYFKEEKCDIVFLETGLGGRLDATNAIENPIASVITSVSLDHTQILGDTVEKIAGQKAGIIKPGRPCVLSAYNKDTVEEIVRETAGENSSPLVIPKREDIQPLSQGLRGSRFKYKGVEYTIKMPGFHQIINAVTALETVRIIEKEGYEISDSCVLKALENASVVSRIEILSENPEIIIDGGHNSAGIDSLVQVLKYEKDKPVVAVVGMVQGKDWKYAAGKLSKVMERVFCADGFDANAVDSESLAESFSCPAEGYDYREAVKRAVVYARQKPAVLVICGSLYLASAVRKLLQEMDIVVENKS